MIVQSSSSIHNFLQTTSFPRLPPILAEVVQSSIKADENPLWLLPKYQCSGWTSVFNKFNNTDSFLLTSLGDVHTPNHKPLLWKSPTYNLTVHFQIKSNFQSIIIHLFAKVSVSFPSYCVELIDMREPRHDHMFCIHFILYMCTPLLVIFPYIETIADSKYRHFIPGIVTDLRI